MPTRPVRTARDMSPPGDLPNRRAITGGPGPDEEAAVASSMTAATTACAATVGTATTAGAVQAVRTGPGLTAGSAGTVTVGAADHSITVTATDRTPTRQRPRLGHSDFVMSATRR
jgi:hypothetical protein